MRPPARAETIASRPGSGRLLKAARLCSLPIPVGVSMAETRCPRAIRIRTTPRRTGRARRLSRSQCVTAFRSFRDNQSSEPASLPRFPYICSVAMAPLISAAVPTTRWPSRANRRAIA